VTEPLVVEIVRSDDGEVGRGADREVELAVWADDWVVRLVIALAGEIGSVLDAPVSIDAEVARARLDLEACLARNR
jgi:hypothetical protein